MSKLKNLLSFFVSVESEEGAEAPAQAADPDPEVAAEAAAEEAVSRGASSAGESRRSVADLGVTAQSVSLDTSELAGSADIELGGLASFEEIYTRVDLPLAGDPGFHIFTVERLLQSKHIAGLSDRAKAAAIMVSMEANGVALADVITDAMKRDQALDAFQEALQEQLDELVADVEVTNESIQQEIEEYLEAKREEIAANKARLEGARVQFEAWSAAKAREEQRLYDAVAPLLESADTNPITRT